MTVGVVTAILFMATGFLAMGWHGRVWFWIGAGVVLIAFVVVMVIRDGLEPSIVKGPISASQAIAATLMGLLFWASVLRLPRRLRHGLGLGSWSRTSEFDHRLSETQAAFRTSMTPVIEGLDPHGEREALAEARAHVDDLRALVAPSVDWASLRDVLAGLDLDWIDAVAERADAATLQTLSDRADASMTTWRTLREDAQRIDGPPPRGGWARRGTATWAFTFGLAFALLGAAQIHVRGVSTLVANAVMWPYLVMFVVGLGSCVTALIYAARR